MKMGRFDKLLVNTPTRTRRIAKHAEKMLRLAEFQTAQKYLEVGCGNGVAPIYLAEKYGLQVTGINVDADQIRIAQERSKRLTNVRFITIDAAKLPEWLFLLLGSRAARVAHLHPQGSARQAYRLTDPSGAGRLRRAEPPLADPPFSVSNALRDCK
jgi:SAM-dependent methyltransferase